MKNHTKIYLQAFGYTETDFIPSELSGRKATDIHHIDARGMGGNPSADKDRIENLIALTREEHNFYGDKKQYKAKLFKAHMKFLQKKGVPFSKTYIKTKIEAYENSQKVHL